MEKTDQIHGGFINYLKRRQLSSSTINTTVKILGRYKQWLSMQRMEPEQISYQDLLAFMKSCSRRGATQRTIQQYMNAIKHYYNYLEEEGRITVNPALSIEVKGVKRQMLYPILEPHQLHKLYNEYPSKTYRDRRDKVMLGLMVYQGIKTDELGRMTTDAVKLREGQIDVLGSRRTNGRLMYLESHQVMDIYDYMLQVRPELLKMEPKRKSQKKRETDLLFIGQGGHCHSISNFVTRMMLRVREINPKVENAKHLRSSVITKWVKMYNLRKAQYLAGHRNISTTETYLQNDLEGLKEQIDLYHPR